MCSQRKICIYVLMHTSSRTTRNLTKHSTLFLTLQVRTCRAFLTVFSLTGSSHCSFLSLFVFLKDSCGNQILAQSAKNNTHKEHQKGNKQRGLSCCDLLAKIKIKNCLQTHHKRAPPGWIIHHKIRLLLHLSLFSRVYSHLN